MYAQNADKDTSLKITYVSIILKDVMRLDLKMVCVQNVKKNMCTLVSNVSMRMFKPLVATFMTLKEIARPAKAVLSTFNTDA